MAGDTSQDLKTGYIVGATPIYQQYGELIGAAAAGLAIAGVLDLLNAAWSYGSQELPAPQAMLMKMVVEGVMGGNLPWGLVSAGVFIAIVVEIVGAGAAVRARSVSAHTFIHAYNGRRTDQTLGGKA